MSDSPTGPERDELIQRILHKNRFFFDKPKKETEDGADPPAEVKPENRQANRRRRLRT